MNKDLDERLVPNGQYRDASNVQVSTSEGSDVGSVENILGNTKQNKKDATTNWDPFFGLLSPKCIGAIKDSQNEKIYWFLATDPEGAAYKSVILEFDQITGFIAPVLVDLNNVINFTQNSLITGVNILGGQLYFTDNNSEPKVINIARFKAGSIQAGVTMATQTQVYNGPFELADVTVIVKSPSKAATIAVDPSLVGGNATGITPVTTTQINFNAGAPLFESLAVGTTVNISALSAPIIFDAAVTVRLTATVINSDNSIETYEVVGRLTNIAANGLSCDITIITISSDIPSSFLEWSMLLIEEENK
jgi:hypothetical protein